MKNKIIISTLVLTMIVGLFAVSTATTHAQNVSTMPGSMTAPQNNPGLTFKLSLLSKLLTFIKQNPSFMIRNDTIVTAINGNILTVKKNSNTYRVNAGNAIVVRRFWGQSSLDQIAVNDKLNIIGTWNNTNKTSINAFLIRDLSIQEKNDTFLGTMTGITSFTFQSANRGVWNVNIQSKTKIVDSQNNPINLTSVSSEDKLRVEGVFDTANKTITADKITDTSLPPVAASPSASAQ